MMPRADVTYGQIDEVLRGLGFSRTDFEKDGKGVRYDHKEAGAIIVLPRFPAKDRVYLHHLSLVRTTRDNFGVADPSVFDAKLQKAG